MPTILSSYKQLRTKKLFNLTKNRVKVQILNKLFRHRNFILDKIKKLISKIMIKRVFTFGEVQVLEKQC